MITEEQIIDMFPELKAFSGRFLALFVTGLMEDINRKVEDWAVQSRLELGTKKCFAEFRDAICGNCMNLENVTGYADSCKKHSQLGQIWDKNEGTLATLNHPNTGDWYWCIKECPDFIEKDDIPF